MPKTNLMSKLILRLTLFYADVTKISTTLNIWKFDNCLWKLKLTLFFSFSFCVKETNLFKDRIKQLNIAKTILISKLILRPTSACDENSLNMKTWQLLLKIKLKFFYFFFLFIYFCVSGTNFRLKPTNLMSKLNLHPTSPDVMSTAHAY